MKDRPLSKSFCWDEDRVKRFARFRMLEETQSRSQFCMECVGVCVTGLVLVVKNNK